VVNKFLTSIILPILASLFLTLSNSALAATLTANVDRKQITENDSFRLFLRFDEQVGFGQPDLTALKRDFRVINQQRSNQFRSMNGKTVSFTEWTLVLSPLRTGNLIIPELEFNGEKSQSIEVSVNELPQSVKEQIAKEFFFDIEVDQKSTYVQAQVLYTEKLYYSVNHEDATLSDLKVTDAHVIQLGEVRQYNTSVNGQRMGVYERRFAIFAEESGEMVIPGQKFTASVVNSYNRWSRGRPVSVVGKPIRIQVKATPATYPQAPWLPSPQISISDRWSKPYSEWQVGEPVTRNITINAQGLSGSQLPSIALPIVEGLKYYPDQSEHQDHTDSLGIQGVYQKSLAIVPTQSGRITVPEMRIPWWNIETNRLEYAILPAQTVDVAAAANTSATKSSQEIAQQVSSQTILTPSQQGSSGYWIFATLALLISNILTAFFLWKKSDETRVKEDKIPKVKGTAILKQLKSACQKNDALKIRHYLKEWAQSEYQKNSIEEFGKLFNDIALTNAIAELDSFLYQDTQNSVFNGQVLWNSLSQAIKKRNPKKNSDSSSLKPLYQ
jgi:hypothetical protein